MNLIKKIAGNIKFLAIMCIHFYRKFRPKFIPPLCKYRPTCSQYMEEAINKYGFRGFLMGLWRIARCNPFCKGGSDCVR